MPQTHEVTVLDGALGTELIRRGAAPRGGIWSAQALLTAPDTIVDVYRDYIAAGVDVVTTNTYATVPSYLEKAGRTYSMVELAETAGRIASEVATDSGGVRVAGCIPPLGESYRPDLVPERDEALPIYRDLASALAPYVDFYLCETMSSIADACNALEAVAGVARHHQKDHIVSFTLDETPGNGLRSGESIAEALSAVDEYRPAAVLFNCSHPAAIATALETVIVDGRYRTGGLPNKFTEVPNGWTLDNRRRIYRDANLTPRRFAKISADYVRAGACYLGGCCSIGPRHIAAAVAALREAT